MPALKRILIVDDEPDITEIINLFLGKLGYAADTSHSGEAVMDRIENNDYWAVFCDLKMPGLNGIEVFDRVRGRNSDLAKRFVLLTGSVLDSHTESVLSEKKITLFKKPFNFREFTTLFSRLETGSA